MDMKDLEKYYGDVTGLCVANYGQIGLGELLGRLLDIEGLPMHCPVHHYIVPAALLSACRAKQGRDLASLRLDLAEALERALEVPGGFCGYSGCCGAAVGVGIFWSIVTDSSPMSGASWGIIQRATAQTLMEMAETSGPRCCKRCSFIAVRAASRQASELLKIDFGMEDEIECRYHDDNRDCIRVRCPFYPARKKEGR